MLGYFSLDIIWFLKLTIFLDLRSRKTVRFSEQILSKEKYPHQMEAVVFARQVHVILIVLKILVKV